MRKLYPDFPYTEIQLLWLKTLENRNRSFRPKQVGGCLRSNDQNGFCCLGVASQLMIDLKLLIAEWEAYEVEQLDDDGAPFEDEVPLANYNLKISGEVGISMELLPAKAVEIMNLRGSGGAAATLGNYTEYPDGQTDYVDGRDESYTPEGLSVLNDDGHSFATIAKVIRMFPHFYFNNGGEPTEEVYRSDIFNLDFDIFDDRARYFK